MGRGLHATVVSHTHWDRAWYCTFQEFRVRLVRLVDRLVDLLERDPGFSCFMLDGQTSILEDYLEVRPEREEVLRRLAQDRRITVGPWYVLPDEFLVSPESLVRNLMIGHRMGERYGGVLKAGYVPDGFGHIAQLPQVFRGFDIDSAFFWRGVGAEGDRLGTEFEWLAPDGSGVTAIFMPWGYDNLSNVGFVIRWGDTSQMQFDQELAFTQIAQAVDRLRPMARAGELLLMNGIDHAEAEPRIPELIRSASAKLPGIEIAMGTILDHLRRVRSSGAALEEFAGEFRWGRYSEVLQGVYSTRIGLKQRNHLVETLLERYAEPLTAYAWAAGANPPEGVQDLLWTAWKWLLRNHPHDDIYGSGIDTVHREMEHRFDQAEQIGRVLVRDSIRLLARRIDYSGVEGLPVFLWNPLGWDRSETVEADVDLDFDDPLAAGLRAVDREGHPIPHQVTASQEAVWMEPLKPNRKRRVRLAFPATVPGCGYSTVYLQKASGAGSTAARGIPREGSWACSARGAENEHLRFDIEADGSLRVQDKATGAWYPDLHVFEDVEDAGDEYSSSPCRETLRLSSRGLDAKVEREATGPCLARFRVTLELPVPPCLTPDRARRSDLRVPLRISTLVTLCRDRPGLYLDTIVENTARDHKLSVLFPVALAPRTVQVDAAFAVVDRAVDLPAAHGWVEDPTPLMHQRAFVDVSEGGRGLAVANRGLPSVEVAGTAGGTLVALTLLRCVGWLSRDDLSTRRVAAGPLVEAPGAQCLGTHSFSYALYPHPGDWRESFRLAHEFVAPIFGARADTHEGMILREMPFIGVDLGYADRTIKPVPWPRGGSLPDRCALVTVDVPGVLVSAIRRSGLGDGLVVRIYNPLRVGTAGTVRFYRPLREAHELNLNEQRRGSLEIVGRDAIAVKLRGGEIATYELVPA